MILWVDAQLSPALAPWIEQTFALEARSVRFLDLRDAADEEIFLAGKKDNAIIMSKDSGFLQLLDVHGAPPKIIWITCGNTSNMRLKSILTIALPQAIEVLNAGEDLVEISDVQ